ncbi:UPF0147 family protein [Candidatus Woesearchaeota archaeon]|nr:UPF0147 family protein [Candidatus Woesearchaeota archaeon]
MNEQVIGMLSEISADVSKNLQQRLNTIIELLHTDSPLTLSRARNALEELSSDSSIESFTRTQLFNAISILDS